MPAINLKIDQLSLDLLNPRIGNVADQHEAMQAIVADQDAKFANGKTSSSIASTR